MTANQNPSDFTGADAPFSKVIAPVFILGVGSPLSLLSTFSLHPY